MPDAIVMAEPSGRIAFANAQAARIFGYPRDQMAGMKIDMLLPERHRSEGGDWTGVSAHLVPGTPVAKALHGRRRNGDEFPLEISLAPVETGGGRMVIGAVRDVTERHLADQALARSEAGLRQAQHLARIGHIVTGRDGVFESWSETLPGLVGIAADSLPRTTRDWIERIHPDDRERFRACAIECAKTGGRSEVEYRFRRGDEWVHICQALTPLSEERTPAGLPVRWFNTLQDVTEHRLADEHIRNQNRMLSVLSSINALIVRAAGVDELLEQSCRIAVEAGGFMLAWIGVVDESGNFVRLAAGHGGTGDYYEKLRRRLAESPLDGDGRVARILRELQPIVVDDIAQSPAALEHALAAGSRSVAALPLVIDGRGVGLMVLHVQTSGFFDSEVEVRMLRDLAADISFALDHLHKSSRIRYLANFDGLTGLQNRAQFTDRLADACRACDAAGHDSMLAVAFIDLERMRRVNETLGRGTGDELLKQVGARLRAVNSTAARIHADIFAIMVRDKQSVTEVAHALEDAAAQCFDEAFILAGQELRIGCRGGVAVYPLDGTDLETLLGNAEAALRKARLSGERFVFYGPELNARAAQALNLESRLRRALERQEFVLHYQPKVRFGDWRISGVEALLRWHDPQRGIVPPGEFISVLEESGLIGRAGDWALRQALADQARWRAAGLAPPRVAVNVSPVQLSRPDFRQSIVDALASAHDGSLELEITETMVMENIDRNVLTLKQIRSAGVSIAIDDFGTGYCSLAYIAKLPVTSLKIDRTFVVEMTQGPEGLAIVSSIIALARALKLSVVAEGVETEEQARLLNLLGCDEAQGFLFSRPLPAQSIEGLLRGVKLPPQTADAARAKSPAVVRRLTAAK